MNKLLLLPLLSLLFFVSCEDDLHDKTLPQRDPVNYVDLNVSNYDSLANDPVKINSVKIEGDYLVVNLSYGGGCKEHVIDLARMHPWCGTPPLPPPTFEIRHNANEDPCEAWFTETFKFDLSPLKEEGESPMKIAFNAKEYSDGHFHKELSYSYE